MAQKIESFLDLKIGDYVVHENSGIGRYTGIEQITVNGIKKDYIKNNLPRWRQFICTYRPNGQGTKIYRFRC